MKSPMTFSTTAEALEWLKAETGEQLSESRLLDLAAGCSVVLHAAPPLDRKAELMTFDAAGIANGTNPRGYKTKCSIGWKMVQLFPFHIGQILTIGETESIHAAGQLDTGKEEYYFFPEPVRVTRDQVRVSRGALLELTKRVKNIQARTHAEQQLAASSGAPEIDEPPWKTEAVILGEKYIKAWRDEGYEPTGADAALYIEGEFSTLGIYGKRGEVLDAAYIARHALTGITGNKPGHKSKKPKVPDGKRSKLP